MSRSWWIRLTMVLAVVTALCVVAALVVWHAPGEQKAWTAAGLAAFSCFLALVAAAVSEDWGDGG